ncbi:DUF2182 domain-containing protein [Thalassotalea sp. ND16A]|uniref:DUF2182 domain-containing protein n=1 Tax=Thalassotalea sp. ND16A TaxID=1535422 RepID=UPI00051D3128|nr:DUF2182 domain-containing protein [Thalassotalea sp. ND16A]KGK00574.1 hypothetical protein ND16A_3334 [Thalassotalea sp. ND16A]
MQGIANRIMVLATILLCIYFSWYYMLYGMTMNMEPVATWTTYDIALLFLMWAIMMAGMMLPSAIPVILLVEKISQKRKQHNSNYTPPMFFSLGYILAWASYSLLITLLQWWFHHLALLTPMMDSADATFSYAILIIAGIYQFTPFKQRCLQLCRSPLAVLNSHFKEGKLNAIYLGLHHGSYCVGCCWFLMAILFVSGVMNLTWILLLTIMVMIEKAFPKGEIMSKVFGVMLILLGLSYAL